MRTIFAPVVAAVATLGLTLSAAPAAVSAAAPETASVVGVATAKKGKAGKITMSRSAKGVQPGLKQMKITAKTPGTGKVKFTLTGKNLKKNKKVKLKNGKAVYKVPPLGTGQYKVKAAFAGKIGKIGFQVFDSALTVSTTNISCSTDTSSYSPGSGTFTPISGTVKFKGKKATKGFVDFYKDGKNKGGNNNPNFLGFVSVKSDPAGTFDDGEFGAFCRRVVDGGSKTPPFGPGTYRFQAFYTDTASFADYVSSNFLTVTVYDPA